MAGVPGLEAETFVRHMRCPRVIDQNHFLGGSLGGDARIRYAACGLAVKPQAA